VCPLTSARLVRTGDTLVCLETGRNYEIIKGVPILFPDIDTQRAYIGENKGDMDSEYRSMAKVGLFRKWLNRFLGADFRSEASIKAFSAVFDGLSHDAICLSIGGGPRREHPQLININISNYENVDIVADAYAIPYASGTVDAVFCEAVLEHLEFPDKAVCEMFRVLKRGGKVYAATPFLQWYHGYPNHFQNFTLTGHERLFKRAGFSVVESGACVGPIFAITTFNMCFLKLYMPRFVRLILGPLAILISLIIRPFDRIINKSPLAHVLASTTYLVAQKPGDQ